MPRNESTTTKRLTANDVYELTSAVLQEYFELDMDNSEDEASDIWDVLVTVAAQQTTVETACGVAGSNAASAKPFLRPVPHATPIPSEPTIGAMDAYPTKPKPA